MSLSLYRTKEFELSVKLFNSAAQPEDYGFIAVLALAQRLKIPFLPITWQALRDDLGRGGQARICQASANVETSFAFKRSVNSDEDTPFRAIVSEMIMLSHHVIRDHPYVVTLEGICWDIPNDSQVWPVLIFEKSIHGDLLEFVQAGLGRSLSIQEKLKLCTDIGIAVRDMHSNSICFFLYMKADVTNSISDIIHGDIKHQNVLVFKNKNDRFVAKMADFGFSTAFLGENDKISFPRSRPWNAPEYHERYFSPEQAKRMDIYSFGLLCFWFLFGTSDQLPLYENTESVNFEGKGASLNIIERLKKNEDDNFLKWIAWVLDRQDNIKDTERYNLKQFFRFTLVRKPDQRNMNYDHLLSSLASHRLNSRTILIFRC